jgi:uncharacterized protein YbjQ (UPF0145 family)
MIYSTTSHLQGREVEAYLGVVFGDSVLGVNLIKDFLGGLRDIVGGRSGTYERELGAARDAAMQNLTEQARSIGADGILGIQMSYQVLGANNGMLMVSATGTAVRLKRESGGAWDAEPRKAAAEAEDTVRPSGATADEADRAAAEKPAASSSPWTNPRGGFQG